MLSGFDQMYRYNNTMLRCRSACSILEYVRLIKRGILEHLTSIVIKKFIFNYLVILVKYVFPTPADTHIDADAEYP